MMQIVSDVRAVALHGLHLDLEAIYLVLKFLFVLLQRLELASDPFNQGSSFFDNIPRRPFRYLPR